MMKETVKTEFQALLDDFQPNQSDLACKENLAEKIQQCGAEKDSKNEQP